MPGLPTGGRHRGFCFTLNNPVGVIDVSKFGSAYCVYQKEKGEGNTPHFQGFVYFANARTFAQLKKMLPRAHWAIMNGSVQENEHYCSKPIVGCECKHCKDCPARLDGPFRSGERPKGQGTRSDLNSVKEMIDEGKSEVEIARSAFGTWCRYYRAFNRYRILTNIGRTWQTECLVYWGPSGSGKSRHALELGGESQFWLPPPHANGSVWWDGYDGQETVVIDEFYGWIRRDVLQRIIDRYPYQVETKGGSVPFVAKRVIITSNKAPEDWYPKAGLGSMARRLVEPIGYVFYVGLSVVGAAEVASQQSGADYARNEDSFDVIMRRAVELG